MTLKQNWADGNTVRASDINAIASTINDVATITATAVKTEAYSAQGGQFVPCNATVGAFTVTLPTLVTDGARVLVKKIDSTSNVVTVACQGSDRFNKTGGVTSVFLSITNQAVTVQYAASTAIWYVVSGDLPSSTIGQSIVTAADAATVRTLIDTISSSDSRLTDTRTPTDASVTAAKLATSLSTTLATLTGTQALTNKTLTGAKFNNVYDTNGNIVLGLSPQATPTNYLSVSNTATLGTPGISALASGDTNVGISLLTKGSGAVSVSVPTGQSVATISGTGVDALVNLNLTTKGAGVVKANNVEVVTLSGTQTLTGKTISGSSNTFSNIPAAAITGIVAGGGSSVSSTDYETLGTADKVSIGSIANIANGSGQSTLVLPSINNDLNYHFLRGGTITITKNGSAAVSGTDYTADADNAFSPRSQHWFLTPTSTSDTFIIEVSHTYISFTTPTVYGIDQRTAQSAKNVTIEAWDSITSAWVSVGSVTNNVTGSYAKTSSGTNARTKVRYTLTNFVTTQCRINALFAATPQGLSTEAFLPRNGGTLYGTAASAPTITAGGADTNISLNLASKGTGVVRANNVEVVTVSGTQTLTNKTISGYAPLTSGQIESQYLPTSSYATNIGNGSATTFTITHGLNTLDVLVSVWETATGAEVNCDKARTTSGTVVLTFATAPSANAYRVVVLSNGNMGSVVGGGGGGGTSSWGVSTLTTAQTLAGATNFTYIVLLSVGSVPTLPTAIGNSSRYLLKNIHSADRTIYASAGQTIEGQSTMVLSPGASIELVSDTLNWRII
jgi:hypothetical protein